MRLIAAEKSSIEKTLRDGLISSQAAVKLLEEINHHMDQLVPGDKVDVTTQINPLSE